MAAGFFRGTSFEQDSRFSNKWKKLLSTTKFPEIYSQQVETKRVQLDSIRTWVSRKLHQLLGFEDDVVVDFALSFLESYETPDPRELHLNMSGFLEDKTFTFMQELWSLLLEAQKEAKVVDGKVVAAGVPPSLVEELRRQLEEKQRAKETVEERLKQGLQSSPSYDIEPSRLPSEGERKDRMNKSTWDSDSESSYVEQVKNTQAVTERHHLERRHRRRRTRRRSRGRSRSRDRRRRRERTPSKSHHHRHRHHRSSHRHRSRERKLRDEKGSDSRERNVLPRSEQNGTREEDCHTNQGFDTRLEETKSGNEEEQTIVMKESRVDSNSRDSLLAELARVERETELRRKALESMHSHNK